MGVCNNIEPIKMDLIWTQEEDDALLDNYYRLDTAGFISFELWERLKYRMYRDFPPEITHNKTTADYKFRLETLYNDYEYKQHLAQLAADLDTSDDDDETEHNADYFNDPDANYCDYCTLNVYDCDC